MYQEDEKEEAVVTILNDSETYLEKNLNAASNNLRILPALPARCCLVAERGVWGGEAALEEEIVGRLVAKPIGVLAPSPKVRILDRLRWQLRPKDLWSAENNRNCCSCTEKLKREIMLAGFTSFESEPGI